MPRLTLAAAAALAALAACAAPAPASAAAGVPSPPAHQSLAGDGWKLSNGEGVNLDVAVPVMALQAMEDAGLVGDPLWRCVFALDFFPHACVRARQKLLQGLRGKQTGPRGKTGACIGLAFHAVCSQHCA
jgi:hypothetical protein